MKNRFAAALAAAMLFLAGPGLAQKTDSALVAELQRYLRDGGAIATAPAAHWASDVIAGGLIGTLIGRAIVRRHTREEDHPDAPPPAYAFRIAPVVAGGRYGFMASASF